MEEIKKEPVTILLILLNALIFLIVEITGGSENGQHMLECGAVYAPLIFLEVLEEICSLCFLICRQKNTHYPQEHLVRYLQLWEE